LAIKRDYYEVLGLTKSATDDEIKKAYRKLAKEHHPDLNPDNKQSEERFKEVNEAYETLSNPEKRQKFDQYGHAGVDPNFGGGGFSGFNGNVDMGDLGDIFSNIGDIFGFNGTSSRRNGPARGGDINIHTVLSFEEAAKGVKKQIESPRIQQCNTCSGTGAKKGTNAETCRTCQGAGTVKVNQRTPFGVMSSSRACEQCGGKGKIIKEPCSDCNGVGLVRKNHKLDVDIPAGINEGQVITLRGMGDAGRNGGPAGDLDIAISIRPHPLFTRNNFDVWCDLPITFTQAALGSEVIVPTLEGKVSYTIPIGTQSGESFRLRGRGIQHLNRKTKGDQYVKVVIEVPKNLNEKQKQLLKQFEETTNDTHYEKRKGFMKKFKDAMGI
jgi:molecular chaperone DnaJ